MPFPSEPPRRPRLPGGIVPGLILIGLGVAFLFSNLGMLYLEDVLRYWPCALVLGGLVRLWNRGFLNLWGHALVLGGSLLQLSFLGYENGVEKWWPLAVVWIGVFIIVRAFVQPAPSRSRRCPAPAPPQQPPTPEREESQP